MRGFITRRECRGRRMRNVITVMNAKGGVGKSTLVLTLAETLSAYHGVRVLVIDSDAHASLSSMLISANWFASLQSEGKTFVDYLIAVMLNAARVSWKAFVLQGVSDVDDARSVDLLLGGGHLTLFEREVSKRNHEAGLRKRIRAFLAEAREDLRLDPDRQRAGALGADRVLAARGRLLPVACQARLPLDARAAVSPAVRRARHRDGVCESLGYHHQHERPARAGGRASSNAGCVTTSRASCFKQAIPRTTVLQTAAYFSVRTRSYAAKYPGKVGRVLRELAVELLGRLAGGAAEVPDGGRRPRERTPAPTQQATR